VNPSNLFGRLTSLVPGAAYLSTASRVLDHTIGQVDAAGDASAQVLIGLHQLQDNLDNHLISDLSDPNVTASKLRGDLLNLVHEADYLRELPHGGDVRVAVPGTDTSLSLQTILTDVRFAIHSLATGQPLSKLPSVEVVFALEAELPGVSSP
jgi:hypothetical protein